ncbi:MAG: potassium/proton antiporter, partial [Alphaproteobacteria bacterium]|nr:potassium/proton antiporter [Alphaproteobacteria bacterium]
AGILSSLVASRFGAPLLLVFLVIGMLAGEEGPGGVVFSDYQSTYIVGSLALAVILFDGGLRTKFASFRVALRPALVLATAGVVLTAAIAGLISMPLLGLTLLEGLLLGAIVASTDGAAVFFLLRTGGLQLKQRVGTTLEIESGTNDPVAVFLTIVIVEMLLAGTERPGWNVLGSLGDQALLGSVLGVGGGFAASWILNHADLPSGLQPVFVTTAAILIFGLTSVAGGSGFLAIYLAGLVVDNRPIRGFASVTSFHDAATWLAQIVMFLLLGLLVTPSQLVAHALPALGIALGLMLVARPVAVWLCLLPFRFSWREKGFISWVGLRGAVSIFLASIPMLTGLPRAELYFNVAFFVVLVSLLVQGWTTLPSARWLDVALPRVRHQVRRVELDLPGELGYEMVGYPVPEDSPILHHARIPDWARLVFVVRDHRVVTPLQAGALEEGDHVYFVVPPWRVQILDHLFAPPDEFDEADRDFFGEFTFDGDLHLGSLATLYGIEVPAAVADRTLAEHFARSINEHPVIGDRLNFGRSALIVREVEGDRVAKVGLQLETPEPRHARLDRLRALAVAAARTGRRLLRLKGREP